MNRRHAGVGLILASLAFAAMGACKGKSSEGSPSASATSTTSTTSTGVTSATGTSSAGTKGSSSVGTSSSGTSVSGTASNNATVGGLPIGPASPVARPRYLRRQKPFSAQASSIFDDKKSHEKHPALDAFDGDRRTAWIEGVDGDGKGEWLEGGYSAPQKIWGILVDTGIVRTKGGTPPGTSVDLFTQNVHAKQLRLRLDDVDVFAREVATGETAIAWEGLDRTAQKIRVLADDVFAGTKWHDFGITEVAVLVDGTTFPTVPEAMVQTEVDAIASSPDAAKDAAKILGRFGANPPPNVLDGRQAVASLQKVSLVDGTGAERVLSVSFLGVADETGMRDEDVYVVFLGAVGDRLLGLGSDAITTKTKDGAPLQLAFQKLHADSADDAVATWSSCTTGPAKSCNGLRAWSFARGFPERVVDLLDENAPTIAEGGAPHAIATAGISLTYDAKANAYR